MKNKFLKEVMMRSTDKFMIGRFNHAATALWVAATKLLSMPDAIDDHSQAHGEGRLKK